MHRVSCVIAVVLVGTAVRAAEPYRVVLTDVERNIYIESIRISSREVTPPCPVGWSVHKYVLHGGKQEGVEVIEINNGRLRLKVVPTRGMSIQEVSTAELRLGWDSPVRGLVHPKFVNLNSREGLGWLDGFNEWLVRCGLEFFGAPGPDEFIDNTGKKSKMELTLHGKIANTPASVVELVIDRKPPYRIRVRGRVDEAILHGPKLELWSEVSTTAGSAALQISDKVTNLSAVEQEFGILYHANYGPPLMEQDARFVAPVRRVSPINDISASGVNSYDLYPAPRAGVAEQVFCIQLWADEEARTKVMLRNAEGDKGVAMSFSTEQLPYFTLWKNPVALEDGYVTGLEPGTGFSRNRSVERKFGRVPRLGPHQSRTFTIDFQLITDRAGVARTARQIAAIQGGRKTRVDKEPLPVEQD